MSPQNDIVRFQVNVPQSCKLKFASPRMCQTPYGERAMFSLHGGRIMFLEPKVAESIKMLELHPGEEFFIAKRNTKDRGEYWDVWLGCGEAAGQEGGGARNCRDPGAVSSHPH